MSPATAVLPPHLALHEAQGLCASHPVAQFEQGNLKNFVYLVVDWPSKQALWVDPQKDVVPIFRALQEHQLKLVGVVLTHTHHDHMAGLPAIVGKHFRLPVYVHPADVTRLPRELLRQTTEKSIRDGDEIVVGAIRLQVVHTPGHSPGECCFVMRHEGRPYLFSGDTLFIRDCGRTDFPDSDNEKMFESLQKLKQLPDETVVLPGHHYREECASTIGIEKISSAPLLAQTEQELAALP